MQPISSKRETTSPKHDDIANTYRPQLTSDLPRSTLPELPESSNAPSTARRTLAGNSPQQGSSREMTPAEGVGAIKYTRTGRVSRANKGKRVHHCEECGKVRLSHLIVLGSGVSTSLPSICDDCEVDAQGEMIAFNPLRAIVEA